VRLHHEVASSGTRCLSCKLIVLVPLGGCHLLDGLVVSSLSQSPREDCVELQRRIYEGYCTHPTGAMKSNAS
jgi:hypothetical protein